ncbi:MAG: Mov34/MPN/PAD-1 family protein [Anaerolineae bacterium]
MTSASTSSEQASKSSPGRNRQQLGQAVELGRLPEQQPPLRRALRLHGAAPHPGQVHIVAGRDALSQIAAHSNSRLDTELGGALLGHAFRHNGQLFVELTAALPAESRDHGPIHFTFSADSWASLNQERAAKYPELDIVGWFHTHPGLGVFFSSDDVVVHSAAFTLPWHVALVVDPAREEAGFFSWDEQKIAPLPGFYERLEGESDSAVPWRVVHSNVWKAAEENGRAPAHESGNGHNNTTAKTILARPGLIAGLAGLLLGFFLLAVWAVSLNGRVNRLEHLALTLADETLANSNAACPDPRLRILAPLVASEVKVGEKVEVIGTADHPAAARYHVEVRPVGGDTWTLLAAKQRGTPLGRLALWDTAGLAPASYEVRLLAVDRNNIRLVETDLCTLRLELYE